ncbi:MAG TPA: LacI family DNA-binding transcriptional regulator [bacterium]|nr:LacI family DNA-binding transcriptional regulator [bacterium]
MTLLRDVARYAGVSTATVSRVLNSPEKVSAPTRAKVIAAISKLGYRPNRVARRLSGRKDAARMISLIIPDIQNPFYSFVARGVEDVANQNDCTLILGNADGNASKEETYLNVVRAESVDGIIAPPIDQSKDSIVVRLVQEGIPVVSIDGPLHHVEVDSVYVDNMKGSAEAVQYLIQLGHHRIAILCGPLNYLGFKERFGGYKQAMAANQIPLVERYLKFGQSSQEMGRILAEELLALETPPTAIFTSDNLFTAGAMEAMYSLGLSIPNDVSIIGFDDIPVMRSYNPPLTAVRQSAYNLGNTAAELLFERIKHPGRKSEKIILEPELIVRDSCGSVPENHIHPINRDDGEKKRRV